MPIRICSLLAALVLAASPGLGLADGALIAPSTPASKSPLPDSPVSPSAQAAPEAQGAAASGTDGAELLEQWPASAINEAQANDLWDRIRAGFRMNEIDSPLVQHHEAWYLNRPDYLERVVERSRRYLYFVVDELEKRGMPTEIALLPMIESAYNPSAYSRMRAAGIWQFIPSTGKRYGLQQNWWYDGRRDVRAATLAALDYLQNLYNQFGDWELALAAYNWGEGGVQRAVEKNRAKGKPTDYLSLKMPKETRNYLPKLQAVKNIVSDPALFGIQLERIPNRPYFTVVSAPAHIDVKKAAELAEVSLEEFRSLNPAHTRPVITPVANRQLLVPVDKAELFTANLENNDAPLVSWQTYQLKKGENLESVASKFGISVQRLKEVNGLNSRKRGPRPGQMLLVPMEDDDAESNLDQTYASADFQAPADDFRGRTIHRVKRGETLGSIARRYGASPASIKAWNGLKSNQLRAGQRLTIWQEGGTVRTRHTSRKHKRHHAIAARSG
jgi:membrane-bound lytic murein transglycosylase D